MQGQHEKVTVTSGGSGLSSHKDPSVCHGHGPGLIVVPNQVELVLPQHVARLGVQGCHVQILIAQIGGDHPSYKNPRPSRCNGVGRIVSLGLAELLLPQYVARLVIKGHDKNVAVLNEKIFRFLDRAHKKNPRLLHNKTVGIITFDSMAELLLPHLGACLFIQRTHEKVLVAIVALGLSSDIEPLHVLSYGIDIIVEPS
jgi:hypothetical protein